MTLPELLGTWLFESGFFRFLGMAIVIPTTEGLIGIGTRLALAGALAALGMDNLPIEASELNCWLVISEFLFGLILGAPLLVVYHGLRMWGDLFESLRGHQMGLIVDPLSGGEEQPLSILISHAFLYLLLAQAVFPLMTQIAFGSMEQRSPGSVSIVALVSESRQLFVTLRATLTFLFSALLPFACLVVMIEVSMAIVSKLCSGWAINQEGYLIRLLAGMLLLYFQVPSLIGSCMALMQPATGLSNGSSGVSSANAHSLSPEIPRVWSCPGTYSGV